jgi:hypothetical protein
VARFVVDGGFVGAIAADDGAAPSTDDFAAGVPVEVLDGLASPCVAGAFVGVDDAVTAWNSIYHISGDIPSASSRTESCCTIDAGTDDVCSTGTSSPPELQAAVS